MFEIINELTQKDGVGVIPTDTVYGIVACANNPKAVARLYELKNKNQPGTIIANSIDQLVELGLKKSYLKAVKSYWPGPISVVIPCNAELKYLHLGTFGLAVRIPKDKNLQKILAETGPLLTSSANTHGAQPSTTIEMAKSYFGDKVDFYLNGGDLSAHLPSTIIRVVDDEVEVLRKGSEILP